MSQHFGAETKNDVQGWIQDFPKGGANGNGWRMAVAAERVPLKLLSCVLKVAVTLTTVKTTNFKIF